MTEETKTAEAPAKSAAVAIVTNSQGFIAPVDLDQAYRLGRMLANAGDMIPEHFRPKRLPDIEGEPKDSWGAAVERAAGKITAAVLRGLEVGLAPMQSLAHIAVINGRATLWGDAIPALLMRAGHFVDVDVTGTGNDMVATATLTRKDGRKIVRTFSWQDAIEAGLSGKSGPWKQYPKRMLSMRARAFAVRDGAADAMMGMEIYEEVADYGPEHARDVTPAEPAQPRRGGGAVYAAPATVATTAEPAQAEKKTEPETVEDGEIVDDRGQTDQGSPQDVETTATEESTAEERRAEYERISDIVIETPMSKRMYRDELTAMQEEFPEMYEELCARLEAGKP